MAGYWARLACGALTLTLMACGGGGNDYDGELVSDTDDSTPIADESPAEPDAGTACASRLQRFEQQLWQPVLQPMCLVCHQSGGIAGQSGWLLSASVSDSLQRLDNYLALNGQDKWLQKPLAQLAHGGGAVIAENSNEHQLMLSWLQASDDSCDDNDSAGDSSSDDAGKQLGSAFAGVENASAVDTLRKAALLFAGRLPTSTEIQQLGDGSDASLRPVLRGLLTGDGFAEFLVEGANDRLLTNKWASGRTPGLDLLYQGGRFPYIESRLAPLYEAVEAATTEEQREAAQRAHGEAWSRTNEAVASAPVQLIRYVVEQERPYTEVLTADYIMVNPYSNDVYNTGIGFADDQDEDDWRPARIQSGYELGPLPHAGVLSSPMFLARYPSTDTNRNRARSRWAYYFFLGVDIEGLAVRSMDPEALADSNNPTMNNPACTGCHSVMDPVAGAFQNYGDDGLYRDAWSGEDSLPDTYKESALYVDGDLWYRDMRQPGFNGISLPSAQADHGLQWLAQQMVADARFATGAVKFWWPAVFATELLVAPSEASDADYSLQLARYQAQQTLIDQLAQSFRQGAANGPYNLKDLLVEMALSSAFRAQTVTPGSEPLLTATGRGQLLTPEQLNRKVHATTGGQWHHVWNEDDAQLTEAFYGIYGGIDSDTVITRSRELNTMMYAVANRMSQAMVCGLVVQEFEQPQAQRHLFSEVDITDTPDNQPAKVRVQVNLLIEQIWGNALTDLSTEQNQAYALFEEVWRSRIESAPNDYLYYNNSNETNDDNDEYCRLDWDNEDNGALVRDPNHTLRAWMALMSYLLSDFTVLYE